MHYVPHLYHFVIIFNHQLFHILSNNYNLNKFFNEEKNGEYLLDLKQKCLKVDQPKKINRLQHKTFITNLQNLKQKYKDILQYIKQIVLKFNEQENTPF